MKPRDDRAGGHGAPRVMASAPSVVQQARLMDAAGTAWHAVKCGNLEMITKLFPVPCNVYARGPVGENVMHVAMLLNTPSTLAITRYLVKLYGRQLVNCPIQERKQQHDPPGTYEGQTALHIAIVNRDFDMVKFLVQNGADIRARAWGTFFRQGGPMYYGEYALSFAACTGQKDVVAYLRRHGAQVNTDCDEFGNTALHMCVIHDQADMYDFLVDYCAASEAVRNHGGLTPLCLAAQTGKSDMLQHVYNRRRRAFYSFGKVTSYSLSLREIDTVQDEDEAAGPDGGYVPNALEAVLRKRHLDMLQEPLLTLLLQHKWEKFARTQFVAHFLGYLLLEVSQTILIWLHSSPGMWNGPGRASQEFLGIILALALLAVEVLDYANWSRECYHRRLTMTVHKEVDPPLYPIPGEMRDARDNRQGLFARLSARMGFAATNSGTQQGTPGGWQQRSEGGLGTPRAAAAAAAAAAAPPRGITHPGSGFGLSGSSPARDASNASETTAAAEAAGQRPQAPTAHRLSFQAVDVQQQQQQPQQPPSPPRGAGARRTAASSSPRTAALPTGTPGKPSSSSTTGLGSMPSSPGRGGVGGQPVSPSRGSQQIYRKSHDDPIDLRPRIGNVIGEGTSVQGVGVVDTGYGTLEMPYTGEAEAAAAKAEPKGLGSTSVGLRAGPGPVGEGTEGDTDDETAFAAQLQQQQQQPGTLAAAYSRVQRTGATGEPLAISATSSRHDDDDEGFDPVSVGLASRMRSQSHLTAGLSSAAQLSTASAAAAAAAAAASAVSSGEGGGPVLPTSGSGATGGRSVTFSEGPNALLMARGASGRVGSPRVSAAAQPQPIPQQQQRGTSPFVQQLQASICQSADGSSSGSPAAASGGLAAEATAAGRGTLRGATMPLLPAGSSSAIDGSAAQGAGTDSSTGAAAAAAAAAASGARPSGVTPSSSFNRGVPRAKSFHGIGAGMAGVSNLRQGLGGSEDGGTQMMTRAQTAGDDLMQNLAATSTPADPVEAVQMLERQRTRARSGGGDLPAALVLKRTPASKTERPSSVLSGRGVAAAAADGGGDGGGDGRESGSLASASVEPASVKAVDMEKGPVADILDPHKSRLRAMLETTYEGTVRMLEDPWLFIWHLHLLLTFIHFLIWISSYGWIGGKGPKSIQVREFDDIIVSMMGLSGWLAVIYFFRGLPSTGKLAVLLERCIIDVVKFVSLYVLWNLGFTLAFFTMQNGVLSVAPDGITRNTQGLVELSESEPDPFSSIGNTMVTLVNLGSGLSHYEYAMTCKNAYVLSSVLCTIYYLLYMATVVLLLMNLLIAMIIKTWGTTQEAAESYWKHRWAIYVIKAERRLPRAWVQRLRLGQLTYDPVSDKRVHSHVFETVDEDKAAESSKAAVEGQIKAVEQLLEELRKRRGSSS